MEVSRGKIEACHHLKKQPRTIVKFSRRKDCEKILQDKSELKGFDLKNVNTTSEEPLFINKRLYNDYCNISGKCTTFLNDGKI